MAEEYGRLVGRHFGRTYVSAQVGPGADLNLGHLRTPVIFGIECRIRNKVKARLRLL